MNETPLRTLLLALALIAGAALIGRGLERFRAADRAVNVKGVAEREVKADVGVWPIRFVATDDVLDRAQTKIEGDRRRVLAFLASHGIDSARTSLQGLEVTDAQANPYQSGPVRSRFVIAMTVLVRTGDVEKLQAASQAAGELVSAGVVISAGPFGGQPTYLFTRLNDYKPQMLAEATASARRSAEEFARASKSSVGGIRRASQGVFEILPRDQAPGIQQEAQIEKTLRVVATMDFALQ